MPTTRHLIAMVAGAAVAAAGCKKPGGESTSQAAQSHTAAGQAIASADRIPAGGLRPGRTEREIGRVRELHGAGGDYLRELEVRFRDLDLSGRRILLDCAHGATHSVAPEIFRRLGADIEELEDGFVVHGTGEPLRGGTIDSLGDHRLAMLGAVAGLASREGVEVVNMEAAAVSYPGFVDDLTALIAGS